MSEYPNSGALFKNDRKEKPNHPDYTGSAEIEDVDYWLSAWIKDGKKGKFMSLSFKPKEDVDQSPDDDPNSNPF
jgi:hypothetical protein